MPQIRLNDVKVQNFNLNKFNPFAPEYGQGAAFRIEFDSEAEKKWNEKIEALEKKVVEFHIEKEVKKAEEQNVRISIKQLEKETSLINPLKQASTGKGEKEKKYDFLQLDFKFKKFADGMARKILKEEVIPELQKDETLVEHVKKLEDYILKDTPGVATGALKFEAARLRKLGKNEEADALIERCLFADDYYKTGSGIETPQVIIERDGKRTTTFVNPNTGEEKPNYCTAKYKKGGTPEDVEGDLVDIIFEYKPVLSQRPGDKNIYRVALKLNEIIVKDPVFKSTGSSKPKVEDLDIDLSDLEEDVQKTVPAKTEAKQKDEVDKEPAKTTKKAKTPEPPKEVELPDVDAMLEDEDFLSDEDLDGIEIEE